MRGFIDELKAAVSGLARAPAFTALAVGVLGLGLGAVIFMYGVADTLMLKPPPFPNADRLYTIATIDEPDDFRDLLVAYDDLELHLGKKIDDVFGAAVELGVAFLAAETLHLGHRQAGDTDFGERLAHFVELERFHDRFDFFHAGLLCRIGRMHVIL